MALIRRGKHVYYYKSNRSGGKVTSEYVASGDRARRLALLDTHDRLIGRQHRERMRAARAKLAARRRALAARLRAEWAAFRREMAEAEAPIIALCGRVEVVFRAGMAAAGFRLHARGAWRRTRKPKGATMGTATGEATAVASTGGGVAEPQAGGTPPMAEAGEVDPLADLDRKIVHALERLTEGDHALATRIHDQIETDPDGIVEMFGGDPAKQTLDALYRRAGPSPGIWFATAFRVVQLRGELGGPDPSSLERMLIERVLICWLDVNLSDREAESDRADDAAAGAYNVRLGEFLDRRRDRAHKRFNAAVKTLATARRLAVLAVPGLQLNVTQSVDVKVEREGAGSASEAKDGGGIAELLAGRGMAGARN